jgi:hypothetical protein
MAKVLKIAAIVVGVVALAATAVATFGATLGIAASVLATIGTIATVAQIAATGLSIAATVTAKRPSTLTGGNPEKFTLDPNGGVPYWIGRSQTAGNAVMRSTTDGFSDKTERDLQDFAVVLSGAGPIESIDGFTADRGAVTFGTGGNAVGDFHDYMWQQTQLGARPESTAMTRTAGSSTMPASWSSDSKLSGLAAALWTLRFDSRDGKYQTGVPAPAWFGKGVKVYDPRLDSTYPGGSGSCRALDESTYVWSENPYLHGLTWALGRWMNGKKIFGIGAPVAMIDVPAFVEGANIAEANGWDIGGFVYSTDGKWNVLKAMLQAGGGEPIALGAKISCLANTPRVSLATITKDDLAGDLAVTGTQSLRDRINGVIPRWRSEAHNWEMISGDPIVIADHVAADRGLERKRTLELQLVQVKSDDDGTQPAQLARYEIENSREFGPIETPLKPRWMGYKPGDCLTIDIPEDGLNGQTVLVRNRSVAGATGIVTLSSRSETAEKHDFALGQTVTAPPTPTLTPPPEAPQPGEEAWSITETEILGSSSSQPVLVVEGAADAVTISGIVFEYRLHVDGMDDEAGWLPTGGVELPFVTRKEITGLQPGGLYDVSVSYRLRGARGPRRILGPVRVGEMVSDGGLPGQLLKDDFFISSFWDVPAPAGRVEWSDARTGYAATVPFQASTDFRIVYDTGSVSLPRSTEGKRLTIRAIVDPTGFGGVQVVDDDGTAIVDDDGAYVHDADAADFDLEVSIRWLNPDGSFNSRSIVATVDPADGIQTITGSAAAPVTGFGLIEFGFPSQTGKTGAWAVYEPWEAEYEPTADVTAQSQVAVVNATSVDIAADYTGTIASGTLPRDVAPTVTKGGVDIRTDDGTTYAVQNLLGGCVGNVSIDTTTGSDDKGVQTIGAGFNASGSYELVVTVAGIDQAPIKVNVNKVLAAPPSSGSSGGGGGVAGSFDDGGTELTATSFTEIGRVSAVAKGTGQTIHGNFSSDYTVGSGGRWMQAKWQYSVAGAGSWTDFASAVTGSTASYNHTDHEFDPGFIVCNQTATPANGSYDVRLVALQAGSGTSNLNLVTGAGSVAVS